MTKKYSDKFLQNLIDEVSTQLDESIEKAETNNKEVLEKTEETTEEETTEEETATEEKEETTEIAKTEETEETEETKEIAKTEEVVENTETETEEVDENLAKAEALEKENTDLKKSLESVTAILEKLVGKMNKPIQKSVKDVDFIKKNEEVEDEEDVESLTKSEITARLTKASRNPETSSNDRDAINEYYSTKNISTIKHLL